MDRIVPIIQGLPNSLEMGIIPRNTAACFQSRQQLALKLTGRPAVPVTQSNVNKLVNLPIRRKKKFLPGEEIGLVMHLVRKSALPGFDAQRFQVL